METNKSNPKFIKMQMSLHKKWSFQLKISPVNMTKSAVSFTKCDQISSEKMQCLAKDIKNLKTGNILNHHSYDESKN